MGQGRDNENGFESRNFNNIELEIPEYEDDWLSPREIRKRRAAQTRKQDDAGSAAGERSRTVRRSSSDEYGRTVRRSSSSESGGTVRRSASGEYGGAVRRSSSGSYGESARRSSADRYAGERRSIREEQLEEFPEDRRRKKKKPGYISNAKLIGLGIAILAVAAAIVILLLRTFVFTGSQASNAGAAAVAGLSKVTIAATGSPENQTGNTGNEGTAGIPAGSSETAQGTSAGTVEGTSTGTVETNSSGTPEEIPPAAVPSAAVLPVGLYSSNACMICYEDGALILDQGANDIIFPASMTKMMTAIVAMEYLPDLDEQITVTHLMYDTLYLQEASLVGFDEGEVVTVRDLLYGALLASGADCCSELAIRIAGSDEAFVQLMNDKAAALGMTFTHFANTSGLHDDNHYSTCADMAKLMQYALQNGNFRAIVSTPSYVSTSTPEHPDGIPMYSTTFNALFGVTDSAAMDNGAVIEGGKTGFTDEAMYCLASFGSFSGKEYILVTAHAEQGGNALDAVSVYSNLYSL